MYHCNIIFNYNIETTITEIIPSIHILCILTPIGHQCSQTSFIVDLPNFIYKYTLYIIPYIIPMCKYVLCSGWSRGGQGRFPSGPEYFRGPRF